MIEHPDAALALAAARAGAAAIAPHLRRDVAAEAKDDGSPVTAADHASSRATLEVLRAAARGDAVISEEEAPPPGWAQARRRWFVDPLDGTREFVAGIAEYVVMVGLVVDDQPAVGALVDPNTSEAWVGVVGEGAWALDASGQARPLSAAPGRTLAGAREVRSRFHDSPELAAWAAAAGVGPRTPCGSMGLKAIRIASGEADLHLRPRGRCSYWDSAGPVALLRAAGGEASDGAGRPLRFDEPGLAHEGLLLCGPGLLVEVATSFSSYRASREAGA